MALIKRYYQRHIQIDLTKLKDGYCVVERRFSLGESGESELDWEWSKRGIKSLAEASNLAVSRMLEAEHQGYRNFNMHPARY